MSSVNASQALSILTGSEGAVNNTVSLAVANSILGSSWGGNIAGFSFGKVQLDIGNNSYAQAACGQILQLGVSSGIISQDDAAYLALYSGVKRHASPSGLFDRLNRPGIVGGSNS